ncbi:MAG: hypothetical protein GTN69_12280 [Armatimonadetes bacterium]|nr:hypothetical protein [Armatimonadota bacterium]NIO76628.1 hypothetical protein [Armatimonadota bacterium]NIO96437.1 hypothetical protein [Armatimonadota bacterium]
MGSHGVNRKRRMSRGATLVELLVAMSILSALLFGLSMIYFSCLRVYLRSAWKLPPYDEATMAVDELTRRMQDGMLIDSFGDDWLIVIVPQKDSNRDNVLVSDGENLSLAPGQRLAFYLSNDTGSMEATGNTLWMAVADPGTENFVPRKKIAENIHPELNPEDPMTGQTRPMFHYWPDEVRLWGVEMWITSTAEVHGEQLPQTAHSEVYLRNL